MKLNKPIKFFFWPRFIVLFLLFFTLLFSAFYFYKYSENENSINTIKSEQKAIIAAQKKYISMTLDSIGQDLLLLSDFIEIHNVYSGRNKKLTELAELNTLALRDRKSVV